MGLFDRIVKEVGKAVSDKVAGELLGRPNSPSNGGSTESAGDPSVTTSPDYKVCESSGPSGFSWGDVMPAEENQYNFGGSYVDYFDSVFKSAFGEYNITHEKARYSDRVTFTFEKGGRTALMVEVLPDNSSVYGTRKKCRAEGIGYTRFYHNHHGWWNTKEYVIKRVSEALR